MAGISGCLSSFFNCIPSNSTSNVHNNTQVTNSILQMLTTGIQSFAPSVIIPGTLAQVLASGYTIFHSDSSIPEKLLHSLQGLIAAGRLGLAIALMFEKENCDTSSQTNLCISSFMLALIYSGTVSVGLAASALSKATGVQQVATSDEEQPEPINPGLAPEHSEDLLMRASV
jgi:hypothetical protein